MARPKVFVTRVRIPESVELLERHFDVEVWQPNVPPPRDVMTEKVQEVVGILTETDDVFDEDLYSQATTLQVIGNRGVGVNHLNPDVATQYGVLIGNTPGVLHESCADFTFGLILSLTRRITYSDRRVREGAWDRHDQTPYLGTDIYGKTLGLVGMGAIAQTVARRAIGFDMPINYFSRTRKRELEGELGLTWKDDLPSLLGDSDVVCLHIPLDDETEHLIGKAELEQMRPTAFLINVARGPVVDSKALYDALNSGEIAGAAIDVADPEPMPLDDPLMTLDNLVITPHIASASVATATAMGLMAAQNIIAALGGEPMPACVNPEATANRK